VTARVAWHAGDPAIRRSVEDALHGEAADRREILRDNLRRRVFAWCADGGPRLLVKHFKTLSGRHAFRERLKAAVGRSGATREWNALRALRAAGVAVPEPLALGTLPQGDPVLVTRYVEGPLLRHAEPGITSRRQVWETLGSQIRALHRAGFVHNDLHADNVILTKEGPVLVDLQHVRRTRSRRARCNDLGQLDFGLLGIASTPQRTRVAAAALGLVRPFGKDARRWLRAVRRASLRRADAHARSRTRRSLRVGRRFARVEIGPLRGMRLRSFDAEATAAVLEAHRDALARSDGRVVKRDARSRITELDAGGTRVVVKQVLPRGPARILADLFRGSPARRAWLAGHGLAARGVGVAEPLAFVDRRILGLPVESLVVLRSLYPARPAEEVALEPRDLTPLGDALAELAIGLHRRHIDHGDLKASHVLLRERDAGLEPALIDLEGVRFRRRLTAAQRIRALAQLNASLPDAFPARARCDAFARYARALPFEKGARGALLAIVRQSLLRRHRWSGAGCDVAELSSAASSSTESRKKSRPPVRPASAPRRSPRLRRRSPESP
jgi:tRNA A-37 threonylcarbamoyl transferase component Bud32